MKWFSERHGSLRLTLAVLANILLIGGCNYMAINTGSPRSDAIRHLIVGSLASITLFLGWDIFRRGIARERPFGLAFMVLPAVLIVFVILWAVWQWEE